MSDKRHPDCKKPWCGLDGKYCIDCVGWQNQTRDVSSMKIEEHILCHFCDKEVKLRDGCSAVIDRADQHFCSEEHRSFYIINKRLELHSDGYFSKAFLAKQAEQGRVNATLDKALESAEQRIELPKFETKSRITVFFYLLLRDHLPAGTVEKILADVERHELDTFDQRPHSDGDIVAVLSSKHLAELADEMKRRLFFAEKAEIVFHCEKKPQFEPTQKIAGICGEHKLPYYVGQKCQLCEAER